MTDIIVPGDLVVFAYEHRYRMVLVAEIRRTAAGHEILTGLDEDRNAFRSFRVDRVSNKIKKVK